MATLQKIRTKGPLLVIVIGLALFAFIAGDAWKIFQPHQGQQNAGEINGETISAQDYQKMVDERIESIKLANNLPSLTDDQTTRIRDGVWMSYVTNKLVNTEAEKLGLTVTKAEIEAIVDAGTNPMLQQSPFVNPQTGRFDKDLLKKVLVDYAQMDKTKVPAQYVEQYEAMINAWNSIEKDLAEGRLMEKYQNLIAKSIISNPIEAKEAFDNRTNEYNLLLAAVPFSSIADSTITVNENDIKDLYNKKKEQFKQYVETRDIKYIDVQVLPSQADRKAIKDEVTEDAAKLAGTNSEYVSFIRSTNSEFPFVDVYYTKNAYPSDVISRMDSVSIGEVFGPYYNQTDDSYNAFKILSKQAEPDSVQYRQIQIYAGDEVKTKTLADSIFNAIKGGADFAELAKKYSHDNSNGELNWLTSQNYERAPLDAETTKYINTINGLGVKELANINVGQVNMIIQVTDKKAIKDKYKVAIIKKPINFSKETYNKAYNDFSQFIAANGTLDKIIANAEDNGYKLLERNDFESSQHTIGGIKGTREALKWVFNAKPGEVSPLFECGESDRMIVVGLESVVKEGYRPMELVKEQLKAEIIKDKKAEKIISEINSKNISNFEQCKTIENIMTDSVKHVTFAAPTYVSLTRSSEPIIGAFASVNDINNVSAPIKGNSGIYILQVYGKETSNDKFNVKSEEQTLENNYLRGVMPMRGISGFVQDLYLNGNVKDARYLFF